MSDEEAQVLHVPTSDTGAVCPSCETKNPPGSRYCAQCGVRLGTASFEDLEGPASKRSTAAVNETSEVRRTDSVELPVADPLIGTIVAGRYRIIEPLGRGGMGVVYRVEHARIGKLMALKLLTGELSRDSEIVARFKREALMVSKLSHPNTVQVFDFGASEGLTYLAMEYLRGDDLGRIIRRNGPLAPERCAKVMLQICSSLAEAHSLGIVHRDLKPENIFVLLGQGGNDVVKVLDFGLAKLRESTELGEVTSRGAIVGTPYYMSPEQIRGEAADPRSDIYSLGALMYAALTGEPVFDAPRPMGVLTKHLTDAPVSPTTRFPQLAIPIGMSSIVMRALEKDPARRFQTVQEMQFALVSELRTEGATSSVELLLDSGQMHALTRTAEDAATRDEVERYEKKLRRRGLVAWLTFGLVVTAAAVGGWQVFRRAAASPSFDGREHEPNDGAAQANLLPFGETVRGQIGQRLDTQRSDRDFFRVKLPPGTQTVSFKTTALPNMALCTFVYRVGIDDPLGRYCAGTMGRGLDVPVLELDPGEYLFAVMQDRDAYSENAPPIPVLENISDFYELQVATGKPDPSRESEPNDALKDSNHIAAGASLRGRFEWMRDVDFFCAAPGKDPVRFVVEDAPDLPRTRAAVLEVTPRGGPADGVPIRVHRKGTALGAGSPHDVAGPWTSPGVERDKGDACLELALVPNPLGPDPHPTVAPAGDEEYVIRVEAE